MNRDVRRIQAGIEGKILEVVGFNECVRFVNCHPFLKMHQWIGELASLNYGLLTGTRTGVAL